MQLTPLLRSHFTMINLSPFQSASLSEGVADLVLVRSMPRVLIRFATLAVAGCATQLQVMGPYASQLSHSDIQQITALITRPPGARP